VSSSSSGGGPDWASDRVAPEPNFHPLPGRDRSPQGEHSRVRRLTCWTSLAM